MKKGNSTGIQLLEPAVYWERKLNINYKIEFIRYKKLCMKKLGIRERRKLNGTCYNTYTAWEKRMLSTISSLNKSELYEYIHFLKGRTVNRNIILTLTSGYAVPFLVGLICPYIFEFLSKSIDTKDGKLFLGVIFLYLFILYHFLKMLWSALDDSLDSSFYNDLMHIVENYYKELTEN